MSILLGFKIALLPFLGVLLLSIISELFWSGIGVIIALITTNYQTRDLILGTILLPISFAAPTFYVLDSSPLFIKLIAKINPLTYNLNAIRDILIGRYISVNIFISLILTIITFIFILLISKHIDFNSEDVF